jgi:hypothetical protein
LSFLNILHDHIGQSPNHLVIFLTIKSLFSHIKSRLLDGIQDCFAINLFAISISVISSGNIPTPIHFLIILSTIFIANIVLPVQGQAQITISCQGQIPLVITSRSGYQYSQIFDGTIPILST